jgi:hypothetical protein
MRHEHARTAARVHQAGLGQIGQRAADRVAIDPEPVGQSGLRRKLVAGAVLAGGDLLAQRIADRGPEGGSSHHCHQIFTGPHLRHEILRPPEIGTVMVRGRAGATGAAFNLGEMTVTRASVRLSSGAVGHGHVQGRDKDAALAAALIDALSRGGGGRCAGGGHSRPPARGGPWRRPAPARRGRRRRRWSSSRWSGEKTHE